MWEQQIGTDEKALIGSLHAPAPARDDWADAAEPAPLHGRPGAALDVPTESATGLGDFASGHAAGAAAEAGASADAAKDGKQAEALKARIRKLRAALARLREDWTDADEAGRVASDWMDTLHDICFEAEESWPKAELQALATLANLAVSDAEDIARETKENRRGTRLESQIKWAYAGVKLLRDFARGAD
jgi:hypothetical protein